MTHKNTTSSRGFTFFEVVLSLVILMFLAAGASMLVWSAMSGLVVQWEISTVNDQLTNKMEELIATPFSELTGGSEELRIAGLSHTLNWTIEAIDLDNDGSDEIDAKKITVEIGGRNMQSIVIDTQNQFTAL